MMKIQQVERQTGISAQNIRYYEREGLILPRRDPENRYRLYTPEDVERLRTIVFCRRLGISVGDIRALLEREQTFQQCVERAVAEARAAEAAAAARAELCQTVLRELRLDPELEPADCARAVLRDRSARRLYEQVVPEELRKPTRPRYHLLYLSVLPVALVGVLVIALIVMAAQFRPDRNGILQWVTAPEAELVFTTGMDTAAGDVLENRLETLLLQTKPTAHFSWCGVPRDPVTVTVTGEAGTAVMTLWEQEDRTCLQWKSPVLEVEWTLLDRGVLMLYRQLRSDILAQAR